MSKSDYSFRFGSARQGAQARLSRRTLLRHIALATAGASLAGLSPLGGAARVAAASPRSAAPHANRRVGGSAVWLSVQEGTHLIPSFSSFTTVIWPTAMFFSGLTRPGRQLEPTPDLAESWEISNDGLRFTFKLRPGVRFHDGQAFTAHDVKFTWEVIAHPDNKTAAQLYNFFSRLDGAEAYHEGKANSISGVRVIDDLTLEANLTEPFAPFLTVASNQYIIPRHVLGDTPVADMLKHPFARAPIGTGPFKFEVWRAGDNISGVANEGYYRGRPALDRIIYRMISNADSNTVVTGLRAGEIDVSGISLDTYDVLQGDPSVYLRIKPGKNNMYIEFNLRKPIFQDLRVRKALSYALDRKALSQAMWRGRADTYNSVFPYEWWPTKKDTTLFDNDVEQAKRLLDEAGWQVGGDGIREKDGQKLQFTMYSIYNDWPLVCQQQWRAIGADMKHEYVDFPTLTSQYYTTGVFDAAGLTIPYGVYTDPHYALPGYFLSRNNRNGYNNPKSDELILKAASTYDQETRRGYYYEWQELIAQDIPHLWLGNPQVAYAVSAGLDTPDLDDSYQLLRDVRDWYWTK